MGTPAAMAQLRESFSGRPAHLNAVKAAVRAVFLGETEKQRFRILLEEARVLDALCSLNRLGAHAVRDVSAAFALATFRARDDAAAVEAIARVVESELLPVLSKALLQAPAEPDLHRRVFHRLFALAADDSAASLRALDALASPEFASTRSAIASGHVNGLAEVVDVVFRIVTTTADATRPIVYLSILGTELFGQAEAVFADQSGTEAGVTPLRDAVRRLAEDGLDVEQIKRVLHLICSRVTGMDGPMVCRLAVRAARGGMLDQLHAFFGCHASFSAPASAKLLTLLAQLPDSESLTLLETAVDDAFVRLMRRPGNSGEVASLLVSLAARAATRALPEPFAGHEISRLVLRTVLRCPLDRGKLGRYARFHQWCCMHTGSSHELDVVLGLIVTEILLAAMAKANTSGDTVLQPRRSPLQALFADSVGEDAFPDGQAAFTALARERLFKTAMRSVHDHVWDRAARPFPGKAHMVRRLGEMATAHGLAEAVLDALPAIPPARLPEYAANLERVLTEDPDAAVAAARADSLYAVSLDEAMPRILEATVPLVGAVPVYPSDAAKTNGRAIFLPRSLGYFPDDREDLHRNRNVAMYAYLAIHECGHLVGGTFLIDFSSYSNTKERPELYHYLFNLIEDYRVESLIESLRVVPEATTLFAAAREYFVYDVVASSPLSAFIGHVLDCLYLDGQRFAADTEWRCALQSSSDAFTGNTGGSASLLSLAEDRARRIGAMEKNNPAASLILADSIYEVLVTWRGDDGGIPTRIGDRSQTRRLINEADATEGGDGSAKSGRSPDSSSGGSANRSAGTTAVRTPQGAGRFVATREDLARLYREANESPERFLSLPPAESLMRSWTDSSDSGIVDGMTHTAADYLSGKNQQDAARANALKRERSRMLDDLRKILAGADGDDGSYVEPEPVEERENARGEGAGTRPVRLRGSELRIFDVSRADGEFMKRHARYGSVTRLIRRELRRMFPERGQSRFARSEWEGDLDMELVAALIADPATFRDYDLFELEEDSRTRMRVAIGIDASGSTAAAVNAVRPGTGVSSVLDMEKHFALILHDAVRDLGGEVEVFAFNSTTSTNVYRAMGRQAISAFVSDQSNRDGDFIRYVTEHLRACPEESRYFFLLSDGMPCAVNYSGEEAVTDTATAMRQSVEAGICLIYINVDGGPGEYFERFRAEASSAIRCADAEKLPALVPGITRDIARTLGSRRGTG